MGAPLWFPFASHASLNIDKIPVISTESIESDECVYICTYNFFANFATLFEVR